MTLITFQPWLLAQVQYDSAPNGYMDDEGGSESEGMLGPGFHDAGDIMVWDTGLALAGSPYPPQRRICSLAVR